MITDKFGLHCSYLKRPSTGSSGIWLQRPHHTIGSGGVCSSRVRLPPEVAALAMALSSVSVVVSSLLLRFYSPKEVKDTTAANKASGKENNSVELVTHDSCCQCNQCSCSVPLLQQSAASQLDDNGNNTDEGRDDAKRIIRKNLFQSPIDSLRTDLAACCAHVDGQTDETHCSCDCGVCRCKVDSAWLSNTVPMTDVY